MPSSDPSLRIRRATIADAAIILHHRREMFRAMGHTDPASLAAMDAASKSYFEQGLATGHYQGWLVTTAEGHVIAGGGITLVTFPPSPRDPSPKRPWIVNVFTEPAYRRHGLAKGLMLEMIAWCREAGYVSVYLHASAEGRPLYDALGFAVTNEMRLDL